MDFVIRLFQFVDSRNNGYKLIFIIVDQLIIIIKLVQTIITIFLIAEDIFYYFLSLIKTIFKFLLILSKKIIYLIKFIAQKKNNNIISYKCYITNTIRFLASKNHIKTTYILNIY